MNLIDDLLDRATARAAGLRTFPESTYRLQFHAGFTFRDATAVVPYLRDLGVTHLYASPYLRARPGSTHGYDVIDHNRLNPELGTEADYDAWVDAMRAHGLSHILDTVPNHAGVATNDNAWWNDVLRHGIVSDYAGHFDIAWWKEPGGEYEERVLLPVLGDPYGDVLERGELRILREADDGEARLAYFDRRFPLAPDTFHDPDPSRSDWPTAADLDRINGRPGDPRSYDELHQLLEKQRYRLCHWRNASDEINYRRFFDINDLAALRMERAKVFEDAHAFLFELIAAGKVAGLRIDHPDGLYDPKAYFDRLQRRYVLAMAAANPAAVQDVGEEAFARTVLADAPRRRPLYVVAEKILASGEPLPESWACHGTSGYDFLIQVNGLFVEAAHEGAFTRLYADLTGDATTFDDLAYQKKRLILEISLASELRRLTDQLDRIARADRRTRDFTHAALGRALREVIACFPVYRSYVSREGVSESDRAHVRTAVDRAIARNPKVGPAIYHFIGDAVLRQAEASTDEKDQDNGLSGGPLDFAARFQQLTAPVMAKGVEDTAFYVYNRLTSLNEVGGEPGHFGVAPDALHRYLLDRQQRWPYALSALSTHDTKRSEDVRARLNVLSEVPDEWRARVERWRRWNAPHKRTVGNAAAPDANEEYLLYQTLVGAWPLGSPGADERATFVKRIQAYMEKALREAKVHTSWTDPDAEYDAAVRDFIAAILDENQSGPFLDDFRAFQRRVSHFGLLNSLAQTLLRLTAPGVPDTYQGTELWDFSLVDPDNRRPVDYGQRREMLRQMTARVETAGADRSELIRELLRDKEDGRVKLFVTWQALTCRREHAGLFTEGDYLPVEVTGPRRDHVFAFARRQGDRWAVVAVPRLLTRLASDGELPVGRETWQDTVFSVPGLPADVRLRNVFTGETVTVGGRQNHAAIRAAETFGLFPVVLLLLA